MPDSSLAASTHPEIPSLPDDLKNLVDYIGSQEEHEGQSTQRVKAATKAACEWVDAGAPKVKKTDPTRVFIAQESFISLRAALGYSDEVDDSIKPINYDALGTLLVTIWERYATRSNKLQEILREISRKNWREFTKTPGGTSFLSKITRGPAN